MSNIRATFSINAAGTVWGAIDGDISNQTDLQDALDLKADKSELETDIEEVNTAISNLSDTVLDNYNTLDDKIDVEISNRVSADETLQDNIDTLSNTVTNNYTDLSDQIGNLSDTVADNYTELNNKILDNTADITTNTSSITNINSKIPEQASAVNQLADKNFVNSSIATNTANFIGTFNSIAELEAYSGTLTNNDYAFVATTDTAGNTLYDRYKWNGSEWLFEYELNNSSFTANQWAAINSGITNTLTTQITTNQNAITNIQNNYVPNTRTINSKALNTNITLNALDVGALANTTTINDLTTTAQQNALNSGATSAKISQIATNTNAISTINGKIPADSSSSNKLVTASALSNAVVDLANQDLSNLTETGNNRLHALKAYSDNGEILTDAEGLNDVIKYAHSTFDLSKFTVVGSPTITDDGIASGLDNRNYIYVDSFSCPNRFIFKGKFKPITTTLAQKLFNIGVSEEHPPLGLSYIAGRRYQLFITSDNTNIASYYDSIDYCVTLNVWNYYKFSYDGSVYKLETSTDDENYTTVATITSSEAPKNTAGKLAIGSLVSDKAYIIFEGSIDLKQFSITVDGVEVFSGNKTGIDTIKPNNYTVVGTPTISADGIARGFSSENYISVTKSIDFTKPFEIVGEFTTGADIATQQFIFATTINYAFGLQVFSDGYLYAYYPTTTNSYKKTIQLSKNTKYNYKYYYTGTELKLDINDKTYTISTSDFNPAIATFLNIGVSRTANQPFLGSIDLNSFKVYSNNNLVYQPCLKIPYTQSKTGSKIVQSVYRDRVNDMASQFGYANYYTLDEDNGNFTLPQVELSGLIGDKTLRDSYYNGATYWELYSNRRLEQGGSCESGVEYTFPKPFADTNYILTISYSSKTATSFIPSATGDFIAKGTGLL